MQVHASQILEPLAIPPSQEAGSASSIPNPSSSGNGEAKTMNGTTTALHPELRGSATNAKAPAIGSLHLMSLGFLLPSRSSAVVWRGPKKTAMVRQFLTDVLWPRIDYLLIDTPPGTSDEHISLAEQLLKEATTAPGEKVSPPHLAGAVVVTTPQAVAVADVRKELNFCKKVGIKVLGVVENMSGYVCECCGVATNLFGKGGGEVMSLDFGVPFLGGVPVDGQWGVLVEEGRRPRYAAAVNNGGVHDDGEDGEEKWEKEDGLLVDKYRSCALSEGFGDITRQLVAVVEEGRPEP